MRAEIAALPDGEYCNTDYLDGFGEDPEPIRIQVRLIVEGDEITVDMTGTSPQVPAAINCPIAMSNSVAYCAIRCIGGPDIPNCDGYMRPINVKAPSGTIVNPVLPAACAARGVIGYRVFDAIMGALAQIVPERVIAASEGGPTLFSIGGYDRGRVFVLTEVMVGHLGRARRAGRRRRHFQSGRQSVQPAGRTDRGRTAAAGGALRLRAGLRRRPVRFRGGLAFTREWRLLADEAVVTVRSDRRYHPPYGVAGGLPGRPSMNLLRTAAGERDAADDADGGIEVAARRFIPSRRRRRRRLW